MGRGWQRAKGEGQKAMGSQAAHRGVLFGDMRVAMVGLGLVLGLAAAQKVQTVYINGQPVQAVGVTVNGKPALQIVTEDLKKTGALTQGGNTNITAIQGCRGQTLFNGVLRVTLLEAGPQTDQFKNPIYRVRFKVANGTNTELDTLSEQTNLDYDYVNLASADGQAVKMNNVDLKETTRRNLLPGSTAYVTFTLSGPDVPKYKITRVLWRPDPKRVKSSLPWARLKNMDFAVECPKQ